MSEPRLKDREIARSFVVEQSVAICRCIDGLREAWCDAGGQWNNSWCWSLGRA